MRETIGLLGGSFNPIHDGHLAMAEAAQKELGLDRILIVPCGDPPHKSAELAGKLDRLRMAELGAEGRYEVSRIEIDRPGKTYTVDTLEALRARHPDSELVMIIGGDTLREVGTWRDAKRVFALCRFAVFARGGEALAEAPGARVIRMRAVIPDISATAIRDRVHRGMSLEGLTPRTVENYIGQHRLYDPPKRMPRAAIIKRLQHDLPPERFRHVLGVEATIARLAGRWGYDEERAALAGLLHDCAKGMKLDEMAAYLARQGMRVDDMRKTSRALLHAPASAAMARAVYGVTDPEILRAIWYHNTGNGSMGKLEKLLYLADLTEPARKCLPWLEPLRALAVSDLDGAVREGARVKLRHIQACGRQAHPDTASVCAGNQGENEGEGKQ